MRGIMREYLRFVHAVENHTEGAMEKVGDAVLQETLPITPQDTGALRESGKYEVEQERGMTTTTVSFGEGLPDDRAYITHEIFGVRKPVKWTTAGTGPKYLWIGGMTVAENGEALIGVHLRDNLRNFR